MCVMKPAQLAASQSFRGLFGCSVLAADYLLSLASKWRVSQPEPHRSPPCPGVPAATRMRSRPECQACGCHRPEALLQGRKGEAGVEDGRVDTSEILCASSPDTWAGGRLAGTSECVSWPTLHLPGFFSSGPSSLGVPRSSDFR